MVHNFHNKVCHKDISCSHQGIADIRRHEKSKADMNVSTATSSSCLLDMRFVPVGSYIDKQVMAFMLYTT